MLEEQRGLLSAREALSRRPPGDSRNKESTPPCLFLRFSGTLASGLVLTHGPFLLSVSSYTPASILPGQCTPTPISTLHLQFSFWNSFQYPSVCLLVFSTAWTTQSWPRLIREAATTGRGCSPTPGALPVSSSPSPVPPPPTRPSPGTGSEHRCVCAQNTFAPPFSIKRKPKGKAITMATKLLHHWSLGKGNCHLGKRWGRAEESPLPYSES